MFFKAGGNAKQDKLVYDLENKDILELFKLCESYNTKIGLHSSYHSGDGHVAKKIVNAIVRATFIQTL
jgi:hypothetical protein